MNFVSLRGTSVPALGFGTFQLSGAACQEAVEDALALGYRHLDTAAMYENEREVGAAMAASGLARDEVFLTTKIWQTELAADRLRRSAAASLERLGVDRVDLLLVHWPDPAVPLEETLGELQRVKDDGWAAAIGVSNFNSAMLRRSLELADVVAIQVEHHPFLGQRALLEVVDEHDLMLTAYCPLARGTVVDDPVLGEIAAKRGITAAQVALAWLIGRVGVAAIPKAGSAEHRAANLAAAEIELTAEERSAIDRLDRGGRMIDPPFAPEWDER